jgi:phosphoribulokinase
MPRPIMLGIVGDSGSGKTTITRGLVRVIGEDQITHFCTDDYHRYDRKQRAERNITPLHPDCNHLDMLAQHLGHLRSNEAIMKPVYQHTDGTFGAPDYLEPKRFVVAEGLLSFYTPELRDMFDVRVYLNPPEELRRAWKVQRDCSRRGYTTDQVLGELDRREPDSEAFIRPQRHHSDLMVAFQPSTSADQEHLDARLTLRDSLTHPDFSGVVMDGEQDGIVLAEKPGAQELYVPGRIDPERAAQIEELIWERMHFASHLRQQRLGEFTIGTELHRSDSLALVQLLILYHLLTARHVVSLGAGSARGFDSSELYEMLANEGPDQLSAS